MSGYAEAVSKFNPNHDSNGRFANKPVGNGSSMGANIPDPPKLKDYENLGQYLRAKNEYNNKHATTEAKPSEKESEDTENKKESRPQLPYNGEENAVNQIMKDLSVRKDEAEKIQGSIRHFTSDGYKKIRDPNTTWNKAIEDRETLENFISKAPAYKGNIYRGIQLDSVDNDFISNLKAGHNIDMRGISSWTSENKNAEWFAFKGDKPVSIIFSCKNKSGVGIEHLSMSSKENEVLQSSKSKFTIKNVNTKEIKSEFDSSKKVRVMTVELEEN